MDRLVHLQVMLSNGAEGGITFHTNTVLCLDSLCPSFQSRTFLGCSSVQIPPYLMLVLMPREAKSVIAAQPFPQVSGELF